MNEIASDQLGSAFTRPRLPPEQRPLSADELRVLFRSAIRTLEATPAPVITDGLPDLEATMDALMDALVERLQEQQIVFSVTQPPL